MKELPSSTKVVVIGGGVAGCSCAYHLAKYGWKDVVLLERDQLTSGTTWHAAGLVSQLGPSAAITKIRKYTTDLYKELEKKNRFFSRFKIKWCFVHSNNQRKMARITKTSNYSTIVWCSCRSVKHW